MHVEKDLRSSRGFSTLIVKSILLALVALAGASELASVLQGRIALSCMIVFPGVGSDPRT